MFGRKSVIGALAALALASYSSAHSSDKVLSMSTTTSTEASGLLDILLPAFKAETGIDVKVIAKGTGAAIRDGMDGNVDIIFVHAKGREEKFVAQGYGTKRYAVMHNDFVIVGSKDDPAGVAETTDVSAALKAIAETGSEFISRGDDSGTHTKEQSLWKGAGIAVTETTREVVKKGKNADVTFQA
ncbi:MAG: solute-binding protein, partial [Desulfobacterales bacterium]|nr:solute-binding protein [Desulfobacterales bacterium]